MTERSMPCPGCADGTLLCTWPPPRASPYRPAPQAAVQVQACRVCAGVWVDQQTLQSLLDSAARTAPPSGAEVRRKTMAPGLATSTVTYRHCPRCKQAMLRKNFGSISGIVVDVCARHGTFFDYGELPEVVDFVRSGGLELSRRHAQAEAARESKHRVAQGPVDPPGMGPPWLDGDLRDPSADPFLRWAASFIRNMFR